MFTCSSCQSCYDVIWLKVMWISDCVFWILKSLCRSFGLHAAKVGTVRIGPIVEMGDLTLGPYIFSIVLHLKRFWLGVGLRLSSWAAAASVWLSHHHPHISLPLLPSGTCRRVWILAGHLADLLRQPAHPARHHRDWRRWRPAAAGYHRGADCL